MPVEAGLPPSREASADRHSLGDGGETRLLHTASIVRTPLRRLFQAAEHGFSLIETLVASAILVVGLVSIAELFGISIRANATAKNGTVTMILAVQKLEQLRSLAWGYGGAGLPISDRTTDTTVSPERSIGGTGLSPSPSDTLRVNSQGYVDYVDASGNLLGGGTVPPAGTVYLRRWSIEPLPTDPNNALLLQVLVTRRSDRGVANDRLVTRLPDEARLLGLKVRTAR